MSPNTVAGILPHLFNAMAYGQKWQTRTLALNVSIYDTDDQTAATASESSSSSGSSAQYISVVLRWSSLSLRSNSVYMLIVAAVGYLTYISCM
jgi:hypothetical protein